MAAVTTPDFQILEQLAEMARVLGNGHRLQLLTQIAQGERSVERLAQVTGMAIGNTSQHLQQLRRGGFVAVRREGKNMLYRLADGPIIEVLSALRHLGESNNSEIRLLIADYFHRLDALEPVNRAELSKRLKEGSVVLLDVREEDEYVQGCIPGAINVPPASLKRAIDMLPQDREIVAYCRSTYCIATFEVVSALREAGYTARRLEVGFPEWKAAGLKVAKSKSNELAHSR